MSSEQRTYNEDYNKSLREEHYKLFWNGILEGLQVIHSDYTPPWSTTDIAKIAEEFNSYLLGCKKYFTAEKYEHLFGIPYEGTYNKSIDSTLWRLRSGDQDSKKPTRQLRNRLVFYLRYDSYKSFLKYNNIYIEENTESEIKHLLVDFAKDLIDNLSLYSGVNIQPIGNLIQFKSFLDFYKSLKLSYNFKLINNKIELTENELELAIKTPLKLAYNYYSLREFNSIKMIPDYKDQFGILKMTDYFITPSYIPDNALKNRESILNKEKESSALRINKYDGEHFQNFIPYDYITHGLFTNQSRILVTGNPGVGKSTYAKWLCFSWVHRDISLNSVPIYINVGMLKFNNSPFSIAEYISNYFMPGESFISIHKILKTFKNDFTIILDGFDELADDNKYALKQDLNAISIEMKYILLTRPYGMLSNPGFTWDFAMQLDGFTSNNIENYIDIFLSLNQKENRKKELLQILGKNRVLLDYAHNPLMLSFITYIYLVEERPEDVLLKVYSKYSLQEVVLSWIVNYGHTKEDTFDLESGLPKISELAYNMEKTKSIVSSNTTFLDGDLEIFTKLSNLGLGKMVSYSLNDDWRFSFISMTFQEFLTAKYLNNCISAEGFLLLQKDKYFLNLSRMVIGSWSIKDKNDIVDNVLAFYMNNYEKSGHINYWFLFVMLLGELPPEIVQKYVKIVGLNSIYSSLPFAYSNFETWRSIYFDAFKSIYSKLKLVNVNYVKDSIYNELNVYSENLNHKNGIVHIKSLVKQLRLQDDVDFVVEIITLILNISKSFDISTEAYEHKYDVLSYLIQEVLLKSPEIVWAEQSDKLLKLIDLIPEVFISDKALIFSRIHLANPLPVISTAINRLSNNRDSNIDMKDVIRIASDVYLIGYYEKFITDELKTIFKSRISNILDLVYDCYKRSDLDDFEVDESSYLLISGLVNYNSSKFYDSILEIIFLSKPSYYEFEIPDNKEFIKYIYTKLSECKHSFNEDILYRVIEACAVLKNLRNQFNLIRDDYSELLKMYVTKNQIEFSESKGYFVKYENPNDSTSFDVTQKFASIVEKQFIGNKIHDHDKRFMIDVFIDFINLKYFKIYFFPRFWASNFSIYQDVYWEQIKGYRNKDNISQLLEILRNKRIYDFETNLGYIYDNLEYISTLTSKPDDESFVLRLIEIISNTCVLLKESSSSWGNTRFKKYVELIDRLVLKYDLHNERLKIDLGSIDGGDLVAFAIMFLFTEDEKYETKDYEKWLSKDLRTRKELLDKLVYIHTDKEVINIEQLRQIYPVFGDVFSSSIEELVLFKTEFSESLDIALFESLNNC